jgi:hypothetical protein
VFTAGPPEGVGEEKYDATAASMVALLRYGQGIAITGNRQPSNATGSSDVFDGFLDRGWLIASLLLSGETKHTLRGLFTLQMLFSFFMGQRAYENVFRLWS